MQGRVNGIAWQESGPEGGVPVVFIHAFPLDRTQWDGQAALLEKDHRVIRYDVRGLGESDPGDGQYTIEAFVDDFFAVLDDRKVQRAVVCGLSMGGYIALRAAEKGPDRFRALVLCDTRSEADGNEAKLKRHAAMQAAKKSVEAYAEIYMRGTLAECTFGRRPDAVDKVRAVIRRQSSLGIAGCLLAMAGRTDTTDALPKLKMPVLLLVGEDDKLTPPSAAESMKKLLPDAELHVIPDAAHLSNLENPQAFDGRLAAFLKRVSAL